MRRAPGIRQQALDLLVHGFSNYDVCQMTGLNARVVKRIRNVIEDLPYSLRKI